MSLLRRFFLSVIISILYNLSVLALIFFYASLLKFYRWLLAYICCFQSKFLSVNTFYFLLNYLQSLSTFYPFQPKFLPVIYLLFSSNLLSNYLSNFQYFLSKFLPANTFYFLLNYLQSLSKFYPFQSKFLPVIPLLFFQ